MLKVYDITTGKEIKKGDIITNFRGDKETFIMATRASYPGHSGKIIANDIERYDRVFNLIVKEVEE